MQHSFMQMLLRTEWSHLHDQKVSFELAIFQARLCQFAVKKAALPSDSSILES